ncbi:MAG: hypothetical protein ACXWVP_10425 [Burkholderiales bacterium]
MAEPGRYMVGRKLDALHDWTTLGSEPRSSPICRSSTPMCTRWTTSVGAT